MNGGGEHSHCLRSGCGRKLTAAASRSRGYGPVCWRRIRDAAAQAPAPARAKPGQEARARALIAAGGIRPLSIDGLFAATSSDGTAVYLTDLRFQACPCKAGQLGRYCYHLTAAQILTDAAATTAIRRRRAA
jgi:hypothetical protein